jgi:4-diphosphocytidyl-2-C-methyl-D-erythritol kinase
VSDMPAARPVGGVSGTGARGRARVGARARVAPVARLAPAKLNLTLAVVGRREDGFHALHSVMVPLALGDELTVRVDHPGRPCSIRVEGLDVCSDPDNLVLRAILATRDAIGQASPGRAVLPPLAARLRKRIPVAAGMGGGSSDAAATIGAALQAWGAKLPAADIEALGASLGSDVPFCLAGCAALVTGRGEHVEPLPPFRGAAPAVLLVTPRLAVSTAAVFAAYAAGARPASNGPGPEGGLARQVGERLAAEMRAGMGAGALCERAADLAAANDLLPASLRVAPQLAGFRRALEGLLGRPVGQSGSGPTAWILYPSLAGARRAAPTVRRAARTGALPAIGDDEPFVAATTIAT